MPVSAGLQTKNLPPELKDLLESCPKFTIPKTHAQLIHMSLGGAANDYYEVAYEIPKKGRVVEATVSRVRNGIAVNYPDPYQRRRDPDAVLVADQRPTDKS